MGGVLTEQSFTKRPLITAHHPSIFATKRKKPPASSTGKNKYRLRARVESSGSQDSVVLSADSVRVNGFSSVGEKERLGSLIGVGNGRLGTIIGENKKGEEDVSEKLEALWDDGYGSKTVKDYLDNAKEIIKPDGGPPRWFCPVECGCPLKDSPVLLFLPGMDGLGLGLILHHKALGNNLVKFVEETVRLEHASFPNKPIYLVGDSFGGCLALAIAACNPTIDLVVILANPGDPMKMAMVSIENTLPPPAILEQLSGNLTALLPRLSGLADIIPKDTLLWKLKLLKSAASYANSRLHTITAEVLVLASLSQIETEKLLAFLVEAEMNKRLKEGTYKGKNVCFIRGKYFTGTLLYLDAILRLMVGLHFSGKDNMLPSGDEAKRLSRSLRNCKIRYFKDNGHTILLEDGVNLLTVIKGTCKYRRSRRHDFVADFLPPSMSEFKQTFANYGLLRTVTSPAMFSTLEDGKIVRGLSGVPNEGPVLLVGYHMLLGFELGPLVEEFLMEKNVMIRGMTHPALFTHRAESRSHEFTYLDLLKVFGALPVTPSNLFKLFSAKSHVLLYPGGAREALHRKGETYKLFWPDQPEFVRMAARFGATIVPFATVGEDDIAEALVLGSLRFKLSYPFVRHLIFYGAPSLFNGLVVDYDDLMRIPVVNDYLREFNRDGVRLRTEMEGEIAKQDFYFPGLLPKIPGRFYYLFGKPIQTKGKEAMLKDRENAKELYLQIKSEVERNIAFLIKKREEDPYRGIIERSIYQATSGPIQNIPTFEP
ncbi:unnamed protein product [Camellia sinensis]